MKWPGREGLIATCGGGAEAALEQELSALGMEIEQRSSGVVRFRGAEREMVDANLLLRCASRILIPIETGRAGGYDGLYRLACRPAWHRIIPPTLSVSVSAVTRDRVIGDNRLAALKVKDAIVDSQRRAGKRSNIDRRHAAAPVTVFVADDVATISLDSSGDPLHERGYRTEAGETPLRETVAATMLRTAGWDGSVPLVDPFCGSGTIPIEAAMIAAGIPPGSVRRRFAFESWPWITPNVADDRRLALAGSRCVPSVPIIARDRDPAMIAIARRNARRAGVEQMITFEVADALVAAPPAGGGLVVTNPPYGERTGIGDARELYAEFGDRLKQSYGGWEAWILTANRDALKSLGLRISSRMQLWNGGLDARLCRVSIFDRERE